MLARRMRRSGSAANSHQASAMPPSAAAVLKPMVIHSSALLGSMGFLTSASTGASQSLMPLQPKGT